MLSAEGSVAARAGRGGTAPVRVAEQLARATAHAAALRAFARQGSLLDGLGARVPADARTGRG